MSLSPQAASVCAVAAGLAKELRTFDALRRDHAAWRCGLRHGFDGYDPSPKQETDRLGFERESYCSGWSDGVRLRPSPRVVLP